MKDKTLPKLRQDWFLGELKKLKLENAGADIVNKTGYSKGSVSNFINKVRFPTTDFLETFCERYKIDWETGKDEIQKEYEKVLEAERQKSQQDPAEPTAADLAAGENIEDGDRVDSFIARHYTPVGLAALYVLGQAYSTPLDKADLEKMLKDQPTRIKLIYTDIKMIYEMDNGHISWTKQQSVQPEPEKVKT